MEIRVIKLGGSVLRGSEYFKSIIELIKSYDSPIVIVVSAFSGQANTLLNLLNSEQSEESIQAHFERINNELWQIMNSYDPDFALKYWHKIAGRLSKLESYKTQLINGCKQSSTDYHFISSYGEKLSKRFNAYSYVSITRSLDSHDLGRDRVSLTSALQQIESKTLIIAIQSDLLFNIEEHKYLNEHIQDSILEVINSDYGHDGFLLECNKIDHIIKKFYINHCTENTMAVGQNVNSLTK